MSNPCAEQAAQLGCCMEYKIQHRQNTQADKWNVLGFTFIGSHRLIPLPLALHRPKRERKSDVTNTIEYLGLVREGFEKKLEISTIGSGPPPRSGKNTVFFF